MRGIIELFIAQLVKALSPPTPVSICDELRKGGRVVVGKGRGKIEFQRFKVIVLVQQLRVPCARSRVWHKFTCQPPVISCERERESNAQSAFYWT